MHAPGIAPLILACGLLVAACGDNLCPLPADLGIVGHISVPSTPSAMAVYPVTVAGVGGGALGQISIAQGVGTVEVRGNSLPAVIWGHDTDWPHRGDTLEFLLLADETEVDLVWLYCRGATLYHAFYEGADGVLHGDVGASGSCGGGPPDVPATTALPPIEIGFPALSHGFQVDGPGLSFDGVNPGVVTLGGVARTLLPFARVDCSGCTSDGTKGWQELHALLWDDQTSELGVAIFYFFEPGQVTLASPVMYLPAWVAGDGDAFDATWRTCP